MPESALQLIPVNEDDELPEQVWKLRKEGLSNPQIARRLMISVPDVHAALEKVLPVLDHRYRKQAISEALLTLDALTSLHLQKAEDPESASIVIRSLCEKKFWTGITGSTDPVQLVHASHAAAGETSMSPIHRGLAHLALLKKLQQLDRDGKPEEPSGEPGKPDDPTSDDDPK